MAPIEEPADGEAMLELDGDAMLELGADDIGAEDADDPEVLPEPPQAVRLSRAAAATPATVKVVRLKVCISVLLGSLSLLPLERVRGLQSDYGGKHLPLAGVSMAIRRVGRGGWVIHGFF